MRQTNISIAQLVLIALRRATSSYPFCLVVNEIGEIFVDPKEKDKETAEATLVSLLQDHDLGARQIALSYLLLREPTDKTKDIVKNYITRNPEEAASARNMIVRNNEEPWLTF